MKRGFVFGVLILILYISIVRAEITKEEIEEKLNFINIEDYRITEGDFGKSVIIFGKYPNYYKEVILKSGVIVSFDVCYNDKWRAYYDEDSGIVVRTNYNRFLNFFKRMLGIGRPCEKKFYNQIAVSPMTPKNDLKFNFPFEESVFEGKNVIKFRGKYQGSMGAGDALEDYDHYYDS